MNVYGVKFNGNSKVYYFNGHNLILNNNICVIVETDKGLQYGKVVMKVDEEELKDIVNLKDIIRITSKDDYHKHLNNLKDAEVALKKAQEIANSLGLDMRFLSSRFTFDRKQLLLNFTASERVDFRELTRKLAAIYRTRIELRQIGARDKATCVGGIGPCGRVLCCTSFLKNLESVSMNMAKNQNLALNPNKINGSCGRLLCCLAYEDNVYSECQKGMPSVGSTVTLKGYKGKVISVDVLKRMVRLDLGNEVKEVVLENESDK